MFEHFTLDRRGTTALLTLNRPPANALNLAVLSALRELVPRLFATDVRALVITGEGRCFCAGLDLFEVFSYPPAEADVFTSAFDDVFTGLFGLEIPVVAAINGHAVAGGAVLAAAADFRLMAQGSSQLGLSEIKVGVPFPTSAFEIVRYTWSGPHFSELLYRGLNYKPEEALRRHLIDEVVPAAELTERALALADELGAMPRVAFATNKRALRREALSRMAAARAAGNGKDPLWAEWRTPEVLNTVATYRAAVGSKRAKPA